MSKTSGRRIRVPLGIKFLSMVMVGLVIQLGVLVFFTHENTVNQQLKYRQNFIKSAMLQAQDAIEHMFEQGRTNEVQRYLSILLTQSDIAHVALIERSMRFVAVTDSDYRSGHLETMVAELGMKDAWLSFFQEAIDANRVSELYDDKTHQYLLITPVQFSLFDNGEAPRYLIVIADLSFSFAEIDGYSHQAFIPSIAVMFFCSLIMALFFQRSVKARISNIFTEYKLFKKGQQNGLERDYFRDEISDLAWQAHLMMSELQSNQSKLQSQKNYFESVFLNISQGVIIVSMEGVVLSFNKSAVAFCESLKEDGRFSDMFIFSRNKGFMTPIATQDPFEMFLCGEDITNSKLFCWDGYKWLAISLSMSEFVNRQTQARQIIVVISNEHQEYVLAEEVMSSETRLEGFLNNVPAFVFLCDKRLNVQFRNAKSLPFVRYDQKQDTPLHASDLLPAPVFEHLGKRLPEVSAGKSFVRENIHFCHQGREVIIECTLFPVPELDNRDTAIGAILRESTAEKQRERELAFTKRHLEDIILNSPLAIVEWGSDGTVTAWNPAASLLFEVDANASLGKELIAAFTKVPSFRLSEHIERCKREGYCRGDSIAIELLSEKTVTTDWSSFAVSEDRQRYASIILDTTQLHDTLASIRLKDRENRELLQSMVDPVITIDASGNILTFNHAAETVFQYSSNELLGRNISVLMPEHYAKHHGHFIENYLKTGEKKIIGVGRRVEGIRADKTVFPLHLSVSELPVQKDGTRRFIGSCVDLTNLDDKEKQLRRSMKMDALGKLTGGIAHDFNNLLGIIMGYADLAAMTGDLNESMEGYIGEIRKAGDRAAQLTSKLLAFSKTDKVSVSKVDINQVLEGCRRLVERSLTPGISIEWRIMEQPAFADIDATDLENALINLVINAVHAINEGGVEDGSIVISTFASHKSDESEGMNVVCQVSDNGPGVPKDCIDRVFDPFFSTKGEMGTGLGLSQVYGFVQRSGGDIQVRNGGPGAIFRLEFPMVEGKAGAQEEVVNEPSKHPNVLYSVLVVDDEKSLANVTSKALEHGGYRVVTTHSASDALDILKQHTFDVLLTDIVMPDITGFKLAEQAQKIQPQLRIQLVSGYTEYQHIEGLGSELMQNVLKKPYKFSELLARIDELMERETTS